MSIKFSILLYSKYSEYSLQLINLIKDSNIDFVNKFNFKLLCVDSEKIRKRILQKNDFDIKVVPCILIVYDDGRLEKYEDLKAFEWTEQIISQFYPQLPPQPQQQVINTEQEIIDNYDDQIVQEQPPKVQKQKNQQKQKVKFQPKIPIKKQKSSNTNSTPIDEIETDDEQNDEIFNEENDENLFDENDNSEFNKTDPPNALSAKKNNLMSLATSMQKSRESFVEKTEKPKANFGGTR